MWAGWAAARIANRGAEPRIRPLQKFTSVLRYPVGQASGLYGALEALFADRPAGRLVPLIGGRRVPLTAGRRVPLTAGRRVPLWRT